MFPNAIRSERGTRHHVVTAALPSRHVLGITAAIAAAALFSIVWTISVDPATSLAWADQDILTGTVRTN